MDAGTATGGPTDTADAEDGGVVISDADRDGVSVEDGDCDDFDRRAYPGAREWTRDGVDSNCDGEDDPALGENRFEEALASMDSDDDGTLSFEEFSAACEQSAGLDGDDMNPGVVQVHASCSGSVTCRGMLVHPWRELFVHDCRGVNYCLGWNCVEASAGQDRAGDVALTEAGCLNCHSTDADDGFHFYSPAGTDPEVYLAELREADDNRLRAAIAFGMSGRTLGGESAHNMPGHIDQLSRSEIDRLIEHLRTRTWEATALQDADTLEIEPAE